MNSLKDKNLRVFDSVIEAIGWTPLIKMQNLFPEQQVYLKTEFMNPGGSIKDRIGIQMIKEAEKKGIIKPGQVIVEPSSGNTGVGLAIAAAIYGYQLVITMPDKMSKEKIQGLQAFGVEVIICPTAVEPDDQRSYYSVAKRIAKERSGWVPNQYYNVDNPETHYLTTGPEIWEQTKGKITHFIASIGTGGTISGIGRYLKEKNPHIIIIGVDAIGSIIKEAFEHSEHKYDPNNIATYKLEGLGEDFLPDTLTMKVIDEIHSCTDYNGFRMTRDVVRKEGLLVGGSGGAAIWVVKHVVAPHLSKGDVAVVITPDGASRYYSKIFNDVWMKENKFLS